MVGTTQFGKTEKVHSLAYFPLAYDLHIVLAADCLAVILVKFVFLTSEIICFSKTPSCILLCVVFFFSNDNIPQ